MPSTSVLNSVKLVACPMRSQLAAEASSRFRCAEAWLKAAPPGGSVKKTGPWRVRQSSRCSGAGSQDRGRGGMPGAGREAEGGAGSRNGLRLRHREPRGTVDARQVLPEDAQLLGREPARRATQRVVERLLDLRDGGGALIVEE